MAKHSGLSQLADVARKHGEGVEHYPVKRKGERRRLDPNWVGIAWLEAETLDNTQILSTYKLYDGLIGVTTMGRMRGFVTNYPRRMFDIFHLETTSSRPGLHVNCPSCGDFAYTSRCTEHPEGAQPVRPADGFSIPSVFADRLNRIAEETILVERRIAGLPEGSVTITFDAEEETTHRLEGITGMTFRSWRRQDGIG